MHVNVGNQGRPKVENSYWPEIEPDGGKLDSEMTFQNSDVTVHQVFLFFSVLFYINVEYYVDSKVLFLKTCNLSTKQHLKNLCLLALNWG